MGYFKNVNVGGGFIKAPSNFVVSCSVMTKLVYFHTSIAEKCFDFEGILR